MQLVRIAHTTLATHLIGCYIAHMNAKTDLQESTEAHAAESALQPADRNQLRSDIVTVLWAQAHILDRIVGRDHRQYSLREGLRTTLFDAVAGRPLGTSAASNPQKSASDAGVEWSDVAHTHVAQTLEALYEFAYHGTFDPCLYPHELGDESHAWWLGMYLRDLASSSSLLWQAEYSGLSEVQAARRLLQTVEIANARHLLEGATETFLEESDPGFLTIRELALVSGFKEESLRALANPKRKNPLPTQSVKGTTVVAVEDARTWLKAKGRYQPIKAKCNANGILNLAAAKFDTIEELCFALSEHVRALGTHEPEAQATLQALKTRFPKALWLVEGPNASMARTGLDLTAADLEDESRIRDLATILNFNPNLLMLKADEARLRGQLSAVESQIKSTAALERTRD
ncbi:hypothetical protein NYO99_11740 [Pelomonas sp. UHG3]|uniref:Uncharacterized protein n=1 Tax=Roseateles hydrophilus TaxID=2975054 RepID=A0ACC6CB77_9BURK|nr:hypothetical protein [Pelomonas sp. UHG3]MCY4745646.1 hypothetical protein [Pelomonas sp. UHG3]